MRSHRPKDAYRILLRRLGAQGWWPVTPGGGTRPVYRPGRFKTPSEREALEVAVGAILTQNTAWSNVEKAIASLRAPGALTREVLARMPSRRLERLIRSSGYFRQKAAKLKAFLREIPQGIGLKRWLQGDLSRLRRELLEISGVGPETADSILLYAGARPAFVVDAYTLRIGARIGWFDDASYDEARSFLMERLPRSVRVYQEFHALIVALAKFYCRKEPICLECPLVEGCLYGAARVG